MSDLSPLSGEERKLDCEAVRSVFDPKGHRPYWVRDFVWQVMTTAVLGCFHASGGSANEAS